MKKILLFISGLCVMHMAYAQFPLPEAQSKVLTDTLYSDILKTDRAFNIFLPKSYETDPGREYPILYLLHGMLDTNRGWTARGHVKDVMDLLVANGEACEMIIVTPNAGGNIYEGEWNGYFNMPGWNYEDFFYEELMPYVEKNYRVMADRRHRAVAGLSMGGGGATSYAQRHPDTFCAAYAISALMTLSGDGPSPAGNPDDKFALLTESVIENDCVKYVEEADDARKELLRSVSWFVDCGDDDFLLDVNVEFYQAMRRAQIPCQFRVRDGGHVWEYWQSALYTCLPFVSRCFGR